MADEGDTYDLVQRQMQDLVEIQTLTIQKLQQDISSHESTLRESFISKETCDAEIQELQRSIREDCVPSEKYKEALYDLETEKLEHLKTKGKLNEVTDKLEFALGEIEILNKQLEREKAAFEKAFGTLQKKTVVETSKTAQLTSKCSEISRKIEEQEDELGSKNEEIKALEQKLKKQEVSYRKKLTEADIQRKQEQYIAKLLENQDKIRNSASQAGVKGSKR